MERKEELRLMLKGAEIEVLLACKAICENGYSDEAKANIYKALNIHTEIATEKDTYGEE